MLRVGSLAYTSQVGRFVRRKLKSLARAPCEGQSMKDETQGARWKPAKTTRSDCRIEFHPSRFYCAIRAPGGARRRLSYASTIKSLLVETPRKKCAVGQTRAVNMGSRHKMGAKRQIGITICI